MMVTHAPSGPLDCRPMRIASSEVETGGPMWFVTSVQGHVPHEVASDARTLLVFQGEGRYIAVWGQAGVFADAAMARRLWNESHRAWVPLGPEDPNLRLVRFVPHSAEFWDTGSESMVRYLFEAVRTETSKRGREAAKEAGSTDEAYGRTNLAPW